MKLPLIFMRASMFFVMLSWIAIQSSSATPLMVAAQPSAQAQGILDSVRASVLQVQTMPIGSDSPYGYGSGFAVGSGGLIITNYHVVSNVVMDPDRYRLEFLRQDGTRGALAVIAVDVVHDLAVVKGETGAMPGLGFETKVPDKGVRGFSIGFPQNQGLTVTEGIINGLSEDSARGAIHFTGPVNPGMSGGPALNTSGRVFGVNVANLRNSQLISFVVPASSVVALIERAQKLSVPTAKNLFEDLSQQLILNSAATLDLFPKGSLPVQEFGHFQAPAKPGRFAQCNSTNDKEADRLYSSNDYWCTFKDNTYILDELYVGYWAFSQGHIKAPGLGALRFANLEQSLLQPKDDTSATTRNHKRRWSCTDRIVSLSGNPAKAILCIRRYSRFEGLYDMRFLLVTLNDPSEALLSRVMLTGFAYPESMAFIRRFMEGVVWKP